MTEVRAQLNFLRMSPRKVRLAADLIRGLDVPSAQAQLQFLTKFASLPLTKLLASATANAIHLLGVSKEDLFIKAIQVDRGPQLKRSTPKAFGRAAPIRKPSSHIVIVLGTKKAGVGRVVKQELAKPILQEVPQVPKEIVAKTGKKPSLPGKKPIEKKQSFIKRMFQRKTV